jgi:hypothetical protein
LTVRLELDLNAAATFTTPSEMVETTVATSASTALPRETPNG